MKTQNTVMARGIAFDAKKASATIKGLKAASATLAAFLEAAGKQAAFYGNFAWLDNLFATCEHGNNPLIKADGTLSVEGKTAKAFVVFHFPAIKIEKDDDSKAIKASWVKSDKFRKALCHAIDDKGDKQFSPDIAVDCAFTYQAWKAKGKKQRDPKAPKVEQAINQVQKWIDAMADDADLPLTGAIEDWAALETILAKLGDKATHRKQYLMALSNGDQSAPAQMDRALAEHDASRQPSKRETRAGGKSGK